jgi:hypothetical protein
MLRMYSQWLCDIQNGCERHSQRTHNERATLRMHSDWVLRMDKIMLRMDSEPMCNVQNALRLGVRRSERMGAIQNAHAVAVQRSECTQKHERQTECEALTWNRFRLHTNRLRMMRHTQNRLRLLETHSECVQKTLIHRHQDIGKHKSTEQHPHPQHQLEHSECNRNTR